MIVITVCINHHIMRVPLAVIGGLELVCGDVRVPPSMIFKSDMICINNSCDSKDNNSIGNSSVVSLYTNTRQ
jgi:hypothetical protein